MQPKYESFKVGRPILTLDPTSLSAGLYKDMENDVFAFCLLALPLSLARSLEPTVFRIFHILKTT